jgi:prevent-host-death family protein
MRLRGYPAEQKCNDVLDRQTPFVDQTRPVYNTNMSQEMGVDLMVITNISEAKATLSRLIEQVLNGQEVIIGKAGKPVAKLVPYTQDTSPRKLGAGQWKGKIWMADDFDDLPDDVLKLFTGDVENDEPLA